MDFEKAKEMAGEHSEQVDQGIEKGGDFLDEKTGGKYAEQVDKGQKAARGELTGQGAEGEGTTDQQ